MSTASHSAKVTPPCRTVYYNISTRLPEDHLEALVREAAIRVLRMMPVEQLEAIVERRRREDS